MALWGCGSAGDDGGDPFAEGGGVDGDGDGDGDGGTSGTTPGGDSSSPGDGGDASSGAAPGDSSTTGGEPPGGTGYIPTGSCADDPGSLWCENFDYVDEADFQANAYNQPGGSRGPSSECQTARIHLDLDVLGPDGTPTQRVDYWNRVADPTGEATFGISCAMPDAGSNMNLSFARQFSNLPLTAPIWLRLVAMESENWKTGCDGCMNGPPFKYIRDIADEVYTMSTPTQDDHQMLVLKMLGNATVDLGPRTEWNGKWHAYEYGYNADGSFVYCVDGEVVHTATASPSGNNLMLLVTGGTMNSGPDRDMSRWISEFSLTTTPLCGD